MRRLLGAGGLLALLFTFRWAARTSPPSAVSSPKLSELEDVLRSRNDNDPRLDRDFGALTPEDRRLFRLKYAALRPEDRNERGTIVHLLGKNLGSADDWAFLRKVAAEPPCLSLADCSKRGLRAGPGDEVTLAYPSLVALKQAERVLEEKGPAAREALAVVKAGKGSQVPAVVRLAERIERLGKK